LITLGTHRRAYRGYEDAEVSVKKDESGYFPRRITVVVPLGESVHHLIVSGKDEVGALAKVTRLIASHSVNLINGGTYDAETRDKFLFNFFVDLARADCSAEELAAELRTLDCVSGVSVAQTEDVVYDQRLFPVVLFEDSRAVIIPGESITYMERDLTKQLGMQGLQVTFEIGRSSGLSVAALHRNMLPDEDSETLLRTAIDDMRARGWGIVGVEKKSKGAITKVTVREPIFAGIPGVTVSWWLMGLVSGFLESIYGNRTVVTGKSTYSAQNRAFAFELVDYNPDSRSNRDLV